MTELERVIRAELLPALSGAVVPGATDVQIVRSAAGSLRYYRSVVETLSQVVDQREGHGERADSEPGRRVEPLAAEQPSEVGQPGSGTSNALESRSGGSGQDREEPS
jgi:hypothetical protein